jgi:hypothetical protein
MKIGLSAASLFLTSVLISAAGAAAVTMSPPAAQNKTPAKVEPQPKVLPAPARPPLQSQTPAAQRQTAAPVKPQTPSAQTQTAAKKDCRCDCKCDCPNERKARNLRAPHRAMHARNYRYASATPWHGPWRVAPAMGYGPPPGVYEEGLRIDNGGWTGGVGYASDGGGGGGYGQAYFANGGAENGPTYNSYGQSFQYNPSQAGPFQPRLMGGFAPPSR